MNRIPRVVVAGALGIALLGAATSASAKTDTEPGVGTVLTLFAEHGEIVEVTPLQVVDPAQPVSSPAPPTGDVEPSPTTEGSRFVAVKFRLTNVGPVEYKDIPTESAALIDSNGVGYPALATPITAGSTLNGPISLGHKASKTGFVVFEIPESAHAAHIQFALDRGLSLQNGRWMIK